MTVKQCRGPVQSLIGKGDCSSGNTGMGNCRLARDYDGSCAARRGVQLFHWGWQGPALIANSRDGERLVRSRLCANL